MTIFFTSDTHYGHANVIKHAKRPFQGLEDMHATMIERWNKVVQPTDTVYHLGDVVWKQSLLEEIFTKLNGEKILVWGNHDSVATRRSPVWKFATADIELQLPGEPLLVLHHYSKRVWNKSHHGSIMLYGHSHGSLPGDSQTLDVGVDCWDFTPVTLKQIKERLATSKPRHAVDHHGAKHADDY